jgi:hypothetical protein
MHGVPVPGPVTFPADWRPYWSEGRQRWIAEVTMGYGGRGKRIARKASGRTKTEAKAKLKEMLSDIDVSIHGGSVTAALC